MAAAHYENSSLRDYVSFLFECAAHAMRLRAIALFCSWAVARFFFA